MFQAAWFSSFSPGTDLVILCPQQATSRMLDNGYADESPSDPAVPSQKTLARLKGFALQSLGAIVQSRSVDEQHWASGRSELIAAKELLNRFEKPQ